MLSQRISRYCVVMFCLWCSLYAPVAALGADKPHLRQLPKFKDEPRRVVSLYPTATEILVTLGKGASLVGVTLHDSTQPGLAKTALVGGFARPHMDRVLTLKPDVVIAAPLHQDLLAPVVAQGIPVLYVDTERLVDAAANIRCLGTLMRAEDKAEEIIAREHTLLTLAAEKKGRLPSATGGKEATPPRVMRLMAHVDNTLMVPGDNSFQNEMIRHAGAQAPQFGGMGQTQSIGVEQLRAFNPDVVYTGAMPSAAVRELLEKPQWLGRSVSVLSFPRDFTSRAATNYGLFSLWLAAEIHAEAFALPKNQMHIDSVLSRRSLSLPFEYVRDAGISTSRVFDFPAKTLTISFANGQQVLSTLHGWKDNILQVGNHYGSPPSWPVTHGLGLNKADERIAALYADREQVPLLLHTGADMDNVAYAEVRSDGMVVGVLATAGVSGNAMRASADVGRYVEGGKPGTINIIVLTNRRLSPEAMTRGIITVTEAKTAVLQELDIRSSYNGRAATGTGTDNVLIVSGEGVTATMTGGHTKLGELLARATAEAVREAIGKQNNLPASRHIFQRLAERKIALTPKEANVGLCQGQQEWARHMESLLLMPQYAGFMEAALALADSTNYGAIQDITFFEEWCVQVASEAAKKPVTVLPEVFTDTTIPLPVRLALNALAAGQCR